MINCVAMAALLVAHPSARGPGLPSARADGCLALIVPDSTARGHTHSGEEGLA